MADTHYCKIHDTVWFKKGAMRGYAHPVLDANGNQEYSDEGKQLWCNEPKGATTPTTSIPVAQPAPVAVKTGPEKLQERPAVVAEIAQSTYWQEKDKVTRKSIERQTSLNNAVELVKLTPTKATSDLVIEIAKKFEAYLEGNEVKPAEGKLVAEVKRLVPGATEVKKGGLDNQPE